MKRTILIFAAIQPFVLVNGQDRNRGAISNKLSIGFVFSPDYSYRTLKKKGGDASTDFLINSRNDHETGKFGYTTGASLCVRLAKRLLLETGILYSNKGYQTYKYDLVVIQPDPAAPKKARYTYTYRYIDIPFKLNFRMGEGKIQFITGAGFAVNFLLKADQKVALEYANGNTETNKKSTTSSHKKLNLSPLVSVGLGYWMHDHLRLTVEPTFRYGIMTIVDQPITEFLWNAGLNIGIHYTLK
jgi:hypothetical protein